jgi:hypothetical protein
VENQTIKKFHRRTSGRAVASAGTRRVTVRASLLPRPVGSPRALADGAATGPPARITSRVRYRQTSAERIADGNRSDFCSTSPRTAPWCILSYGMNQSSEDPDRRCR